jgi:hypothetical protein
MILTTLLFDVAPLGGIGVFLGIAFFFIFVAVAFVAYKLLKKTVKMAVRITIVVVILLIALVGSIALLLFAMPSRGPKGPPVTTPTIQKTR